MEEKWEQMIEDWMRNIKYDIHFKVKPEAEELAKQIAEKLNKEQDLYIVTVNRGTVIKKDNEDNLDNYFHTTIPEWNPAMDDWKDKSVKISQRHQLARKMYRKDPKTGKELMKKVVYPIPGIEKWQEEYNEIMDL